MENNKDFVDFEEIPHDTTDRTPDENGNIKIGPAKLFISVDTTGENKDEPNSDVNIQGKPEDLTAILYNLFVSGKDQALHEMFDVALEMFFRNHPEVERISKNI